MKWWVPLFFFLGYAEPVFSQLQWDSRELEFSPGVMDTNVVARYTFRNAGGYAVTVSHIRTSCGCTTTSLAKNTYEPGEKGELVVRFEIGQRTGEQAKEVMVMTNDPRESVAMLKMKVHLPEIVKIQPPFVFWDLGEEPTAKSIHVQIVLSTNVNLLAVESDNPKFHPNWKVITPGREYEVAIKPESTTQPQMATFNLKTDFPKERSRWYKAYATIRASPVPAPAPAGK